MAIVIGAGIAATGAIAGGAIASSGAKSAAQTSASAAQAGANEQLQMFNTTQQDFAPQIALGQGAANMLSGIYGVGGKSGSQPNPNYSAFYNTPGYQFTLNQGENAINRQAAANGSLYSTNTLGALNNYAQGTASTQYNSYINQLLSMAGLGNAAATGVGSAATATGQGVAGSLLNAGNASASGILGSSNAFSNLLGQGANSNFLGSLTGANNSGAAGQYSGEFAPGVSTQLTFNPSIDPGSIPVNLPESIPVNLPGG
jgi:hypothetical protein